MFLGLFKPKNRFFLLPKIKESKFFEKHQERKEQECSKYLLRPKLGYADRCGGDIDILRKNSDLDGIEQMAEPEAVMLLL